MLKSMVGIMLAATLVGVAAESQAFGGKRCSRRCNGCDGGWGCCSSGYYGGCSGYYGGGCYGGGRSGYYSRGYSNWGYGGRGYAGYGYGGYTVPSYGFGSYSGYNGQVIYTQPTYSGQFQGGTMYGSQSTTPGTIQVQPWQQSQPVTVYPQSGYVPGFQG